MCFPPLIPGDDKVYADGELFRWEKDQFHKAAKFQREMSEKMQPQATLKPDEEDREAYAKQAKELLEGKAVWRPTWQALGLNYNRPNVPSLSKPKS